MCSWNTKIQPGTTPGEKVQIRAAIQVQRQIGRILTISGYLSIRWFSVILKESRETTLMRQGTPSDPVSNFSNFGTCFSSLGGTKYSTTHGQERRLDSQLGYRLQSP